jgi:DNA-binding XRE family transcriptional regulator
VIDTNVLKGKIAEKGLSQAKVAKKIGITPKTFYEKMNKGVFGSDEIEVMIKLLGIEDPSKIFFAQQVT